MGSRVADGDRWLRVDPVPPVEDTLIVSLRDEDIEWLLSQGTGASLKRYVFAPPPALQGAGIHMDFPLDHPVATPPVAGTPHSEEAGTPKDTYAKAPAAADMVAGAGTTKKGKKVKKGKVLDTDPGGGAPPPQTQ